MLEAVNLGGVRGTRRLFRGSNFCAGPGELIEVRGPNGSGKTSLLRIICGLAAPAEGEIRWHGTNIRSLGEEYCGAVAYLGHQNGVKDELSALENLQISSAISGYAVDEKEAAAILERVGLGNQKHLPSRLLSAGQRRRVALSRLLASKATLWILDEVMTSLDDAGSKMASGFVTDHLTRDGIAIIATHQQLNISAAAVKQIELGT